MSTLHTVQRYTYGFSGVAPRDTIVFKSIVGLLDGRTHGLWRYQETGDTDMLVLGSDESARGAASQRCGRVLLSIGAAGSDAAQHSLGLHWPLRANEVFVQLEHVASLLLDSQPAPANGAVVQLLRWPASALLQRHAQFTRLATLLSARASNVDELMARSGVPLALCEAFVAALVDAGYARRHEEERAPAPPQARPEPVAKSLFARIRAHLGIPASAAGVAQ
jgi:hypothetical protein